MVGNLAHALAEAQILPEFLNGLRAVDVHAKDGKHLLDGMFGCILGHSLRIGTLHTGFGCIARVFSSDWVFFCRHGAGSLVQFKKTASAARRRVSLAVVFRLLYPTSKSLSRLLASRVD